MTKTRVQYLAKIIGLALAYLVAAKLGLSLAFTVKQITTVWPPTGLALVALLVLGYRLWPGIFIGAFVANLMTHEPALVALGIAVGNTLEALAGAWLLKRVMRMRLEFDRVRDMLGLVVFSAVLSTAISASIGTLSLAFSGLLAWSAQPEAWLLWWFGDMAGAVLFAPFLLICIRPEQRARLLKRFPEAVCLILSSAAMAGVIFFSPLGNFAPVVYMTFPFIIWGALRFQQIGVITVSMSISVIAVLGTAAGLGPFAVLPNVQQRLIFLLLYVILVTVSGLLTALSIAEREKYQYTLERQSQQLKKANQRVTELLEQVLDNSSPNRHGR